MVLQNNNFGFAGKHYRQVGGVAIGSKLEKNFACAYMRKWDEQLQTFYKNPYFYKRFIDDGFGIWTHGIEALEEFTEFANNIHENVKVKLRWSEEKIEFLDTMVHIADGQLWTDLYSKPSDKHLYLQRKSCHPGSTKKAIPYGLGIRAKRICSKEEDYLKNRTELKGQLRKRGYSGRFIEAQLKKVDKMDRKDLIRYKCREEKTERVPLVLTYSNLQLDIACIVRKHLRTLHKSDRMKEVFDEPPLVAFSRGQNLQDILVHKKLNKVLQTEDSGCQDGCRTCLILMKGPIVDTGGKCAYNGHHTQTCRMQNLVYCLMCTKCHKPVYVGETGRQLKERIGEHLAYIRLQRDKAVGLHFNTEGHTIDDVWVIIMEKLYDDSKQLRLIKEAGWIRKLKTRVPYGLNLKSQCDGDWTEY